MKLIAGLLVMFGLLQAFAQPEPSFELRVKWTGAALEATWASSVVHADGSVLYPAFELQRSVDLHNWRPFGSPIQASTVSASSLSAMLPTGSAWGFFRLLARFPSDQVQALASGGADVFGYAAAFTNELATVGQITPEQFAALYSTPPGYLPELGWDPTTAEFWNQFDIDPVIYNLTLFQGVDDLRQFDFRLDTNELAVFKKNGFVVSERLGAPSPGEIFSRLWTDDLPVYIAADPILHAWHRSYDMMLAELEETFLYENARQMLDSMALKLPEAAAAAGDGPLKLSVQDADYFLAVARSLLAGRTVPSALGQDERVATTLEAAQHLSLRPCFDLFGEPRNVDFSQLTVRGHYTESEKLGRYFKCVMWLGRTTLRVAGGPFDDAECAEPHMAPPRELGTAIVLEHLLSSSEQFDRWQNFDRLIQTFVGVSDSLNFAQLGEVIRAAGIQKLADVTDIGQLEAVQAALVRGGLGVHNIRSDWFNSPLGPEQGALPQTFAVFGQKFVLDSWALSKVVFDSIIWDEDGIRTLEDKVPRRVPSALDVAFSVFGNNHVVPEIVARIQDRSPERHIFRDGWMYQHNLAAVRAVVEQHPASAWDRNLYMGWLATLRELSTAVTDMSYPDAVRTRAWAMKDLNTQLSSWTQLRHDTVLYAEQSHTGGGGICAYPRGYVDPRPAFWRRFQQMALNAVRLVQATDYSSTDIFSDLPLLQTRHAAAFQRFADVTGTLFEMSKRELRQEPFTPAQEQFLQNTMQAQLIRAYEGTWWNVYDGWYPQLFYRPIAQDPGTVTPQSEGSFQFVHGALRWDALVADVHTDVPCLEGPMCVPEPDPGSVLHQGVGRAHLLMVAINNGPDRCVYAGPVMSHYEFEMPAARRLSDPEWRESWSKAGFNAWGRSSWFNTPDGLPDWSGIPEQPAWTRDYLVPMDRTLIEAQ